ncbi:uracil phosphoribosyltransferase-domain-containing protein [Lipomyces japonicus]|uniref:uracil phosphoribosyltransferase-domain-containing protein n=1 Tax=Lipomyces japonicus TaxID=56871 RepID=UPI0034CD7BC5
MAIPSNVSVSTNPLVLAKLSQLRSDTVRQLEIKALTSQLTTLLSSEALANAFTIAAPFGLQDTTATGEIFEPVTLSPSNVVLAPVLRSGLAMVDSVLSLLPFENVPVHHLGLFRDKVSLEPVEYYNKLPVLRDGETVDLAIVLDPVIATGGTASAVIQSLKEWGAKKIIFISIIGSEQGVTRVASEWPEAVKLYVAAIDPIISSSGYILPGIGDIGDRLNSTS